MNVIHIRLGNRYIFSYLFLVLFSFPKLLSQESESTYSFGLLRQFDDASFVTTLKSPNWYDQLKYISLQKRLSLSFGGSYRTQFERFWNQDFIPGESDGWWLNRLLLHADLRVGEEWQFFGELGSSTILSKDNLSPVDKDELYLNQAFVKFRKNAWIVMLGRENVRYGSSRLISVREGPNIRLQFDGGRVMWNKGGIKLEALYLEPVDNRRFVFDNGALDGDERLYGMYHTFAFQDKQHLVDVHPSITFLWNKGFLSFDYVAFWRESVADGIYGPAINLSFLDVNEGAFIGHQYGWIANIELNPFVVLEAESNYVVSGPFLTEGGLNDNLWHFVGTLEIKF